MFVTLFAIFFVFLLNISFYHPSQSIVGAEFDVRALGDEDKAISCGEDVDTVIVGSRALSVGAGAFYSFYALLALVSRSFLFCGGVINTKLFYIKKADAAHVTSFSQSKLGYQKVGFTAIRVAQNGIRIPRGKKSRGKKQGDKHPNRRPHPKENSEKSPRFGHGEHSDSRREASADKK